MIKRILSLIYSNKPIFDKNGIFYWNGNKFAIFPCPPTHKDNRLYVIVKICILPGSYKVYEAEYKVEDVFLTKITDGLPKVKNVFMSFDNRIASLITRDFIAKKDFDA